MIQCQGQHGRNQGGEELGSPIWGVSRGQHELRVIKKGRQIYRYKQYIIAKLFRLIKSDILPVAYKNTNKVNIN
jgi:hypothetical protein